MSLYHIDESKANVLSKPIEYLFHHPTPEKTEPLTQQQIQEIHNSARSILEGISDFGITRPLPKSKPIEGTTQLNNAIINWLD